MSRAEESVVHQKNVTKFTARAPLQEDCNTEQLRGVVSHLGCHSGLRHVGLLVALQEPTPWLCPANALLSVLAVAIKAKHAGLSPLSGLDTDFVLLEDTTPCRLHVFIHSMEESRTLKRLQSRRVICHEQKHDSADGSQSFPECCLQSDLKR